MSTVHYSKITFSENKMTTLKGQTVLVVGGSSGIGFGVAKISLLSSAALVIIASSSKTKVENAVARLIKAVGPDAEPRVKGVVVDGTSSKEIRALLEKVGELDHLVWTAGGELPPNFLEVDLDTQRGAYYFITFMLFIMKYAQLVCPGIFDSRFWGPLEAAKAAKIKAGGSITLTGGIAFLKPPKGWGHSSGMPGAVDAATRGLAVDLAPIRVNHVCPGTVNTEVRCIVLSTERRESLLVHVVQLISSLDPAQVESFLQEIGKKQLIPQIGDPDDVAEAYVFLMK
jgi:NAD(P)-dependent dehydrogenase (short-subunit alcohol dehydrogenase family)